MLKKAQKAVAIRYGLQSHILTSWMHHLVYVRNLCAHHSRLSATCPSRSGKPLQTANASALEAILLHGGMTRNGDEGMRSWGDGRRETGRSLCVKGTKV